MKSIDKLMGKKPQHLCAELPGRDQFIAALEEQLGKYLSTQIIGQFKTVIAPQGFHYGFKYGNNGYYNINSLSDVDRCLETDKTTNQVCFGDQPLSVLMSEILQHTGYHLSNADQDRMNKADIKAQAYRDQLLSAFKNDFPNVPLPEDSSAVAAIFQYITDTFGDVQNIPVYYSETRNAVNDYSVNAEESFQMHSAIAGAQQRLKNIIKHINQPSKENGGMQVNASSYYVGYDLPNFSDIYASLNTNEREIKISLEFQHFSENSSTLSIDHKASFIVPLPVFAFGTSDTKYTLNSLVSESSSVVITMSFKGITPSVVPSPKMVDAAAKTGWYDEEIVKEIIRNTGKDSTGYCLIDNKFSIDSLFGSNGSFTRLKQFVICQTPVITISMTDIKVDAVKECFSHESHIDVDFFGFGISSSDHRYTSENLDINTETRTATITLSAPKPSPTVSVETEVAYVLGGVPYCPSIASDNAAENQATELSFTFAAPGELSDSLYAQEINRHSLKLSAGPNYQRYHIGAAALPIDCAAGGEAVLNIWYYYLPKTRTIWLSDQEDFTSDQTNIEIYDQENGRLLHKIYGHSCTVPAIKKELDRLMEELIRSAQEKGLTVIRRRAVPYEMKDLRFRCSDGSYQPLSSTYVGVNRNIAAGTVFANATGTVNDHMFDQNGKRIYGAWLALWSRYTGLQANACTNCQAAANLYGAHVLIGQNIAAALTPGTQFDILPLCSRCNNWHNIGAMNTAFATTSLSMIW